MAVRRALISAGAAANIAEADSSRTAIELLGGAHFDCVLLDYQLPPTDGLAVLLELRGRGVAIPIVMLTGRGDEQVAVRLMKAGASDYLTKDGLSPERLAQSVRSAVRVYQAEVRAMQARAESIERLRFLAEASRLLTASLDVPTILDELSALIVPALASWCAIDLLDSGGVFQRRLQTPPEAGRWAEEVATAWKLIGQGAVEPPTLVCIDEPLLYPPPGEEGALASLRVPIMLRGRVHGAITMARRSPAYSQADLSLAGELSQRVAMALDNARLYRQAKEAVRLRDEFLSIASHELRTPLTSLLGYVQLLDRRLRRSGDLSAREQRALQVIVEQVLRLNKMISALLDVSRLQSGQFALQLAPLDLAVIIRRVVEEVALPLDRHTISVEGGGGPLPISGDELRIYQVLQNLLQNAVKYSPSGGQITVHCRSAEGWAEVVISDEGIGIPPGDMPHLFNRFYRAANAEERSISGIGLGLYVVHEIVALHRGTIDANSLLGEGSSFTLRLPLMAEKA
jgi:signal transduction histidine kinase